MEEYKCICCGSDNLSIKTRDPMIVRNFDGEEIGELDILEDRNLDAVTCEDCGNVQLFKKDSPLLYPIKRRLMLKQTESLRNEILQLKKDLDGYYQALEKTDLKTENYANTKRHIGKLKRRMTVLINDLCHACLSYDQSANQFKWFDEIVDRKYMG